MKSIIPTGEIIAPLLRKSEAELVAAGYSKKLSSYDEPEAVRSLMTLINRAYVEMEKMPAGLNQFERKRHMETFAKLIRNDLLFHFPIVTMKEIEIAIRKGIRNEFGEFFGFSVVTVHTFVLKYLESVERKDAMDKQNRFLIQQHNTNIPPFEDQWEIMWNGLLECYETYLKTGNIFDFGNVNYDLLDKARVINLTDDEKWLIWSVAEMQVIKEQEIKGSLNMLTYRMVINEKTDKASIISKAKQIALKKFFDGKPDLNGKMEKLRNTFYESTNTLE